MTTLTLQRDVASMGPYGYGSYPRTEATQFNPENLSDILKNISRDLQLLKNKNYEDLIELEKSVGLDSLLSNVVTSTEPEEAEPLPVEHHTSQREEIPQKIHFGLPRALTLEKEEFYGSKQKKDVSDLL